MSNKRTEAFYKDALKKITEAENAYELIDVAEFAFDGYNPSNPKGQARMLAFKRLKELFKNR